MRDINEERKWLYHDVEHNDLIDIIGKVKDIYVVVRFGDNLEVLDHVKLSKKQAIELVKKNDCITGYRNTSPYSSLDYLQLH